MKTALITGITGQDGSYLAELLLSKDYRVHGVVRRSSSFNTERIDHLYRDPHEGDVRLRLHYGDLNDASSLQSIVSEVRPDEVYNLGAQSHVRVSFDIPEYTAEVTALGTVRLLEAIRKSGLQCRFYQASSSELYGKVVETPQRETTPFHPRSPYAAAKAYAFYLTQNYREAYGMFAVNGILFNHECLSANTALVARFEGMVDVVTPGELIALREKGPNVQTFEPQGVELWDGVAWTPLRTVTATKRRLDDPDHALRSIQARAGVVDVTAHHRMLDHQREVVRADRVAASDRLHLAPAMPEAPGWTTVSAELAELLGHLVAEGYVSEGGATIQYTSNDDAHRARVAELWSRLFLGSATHWQGSSGFRPDRPVGQIRLTGVASLRAWLREMIYTRDGWKKVPALVLNGDLAAQRAFLDGYYAGDGLKAGNGESIKTNSPILAQGLQWIYANQGRTASVYAEQRNGAVYYQLNLATATPAGEKGQHLRKDPAEVRRVDAAVSFSDWVFDVETDSRVLVAGVGRVVVHNSERRGETFVTRKITRAVGRIKHGQQRELFLGNLDARRDWGHARDYVDAMWRMLQVDVPDDYVVGTGETHSVREFLELAFTRAGLDWREHVKIDPRYMRPAEVDLLLADPSKAREELGWTPTVTFPELVSLMVDSDIELAAREKRARG